MVSTYRLDLDSSLSVPAIAADLGTLVNLLDRSAKAEYLRRAWTAVLGEGPRARPSSSIGSVLRLARPDPRRSKVKLLPPPCLPIGHRFNASRSITDAQFVLNQAGDDGEVSDVEVDVLARAVSWSVLLKWHHQSVARPLQVALGAD